MTNLGHNMDPAVALAIVVVVVYVALNVWYVKKLGGYMKEITQKFDALAELRDSPEASQLLKNYPSFMLSVTVLSQSFVNFPRAAALAKGFLDKINEIIANPEEHLKKV